MSNDIKIEQSIVPIKMADLIGYIAKRKKIPYTDAMCYFYDSPMSAKLYDENAKWWYLDNETLYEEIERERRMQTESLSDKEQQFVEIHKSRRCLINNISRNYDWS